MLVLYCVLLLVVSPDVGYGKSNNDQCRDPRLQCVLKAMCPVKSGEPCGQKKVCCPKIRSGVKIEDKKKPKEQKVVGSKSPAGSCSSTGRSCIPQGKARSFPGGSTTRCIGPHGCKKGYLCCKKNKSVTPGKKKVKSITKAARNDPGRAVRCPPEQRCGTPDLDNPDGGRCRKKCKPKEDTRDQLGKCKFSDCNCCFRRRKCKLLKYCRKNNGQCKGVCDAQAGETQLKKGCKNRCVCCVGPTEGTCEDETGDCKKKCQEKYGERAFSQFSCGKGKCCLKDCHHWQKDLWYIHGEEFYHDCMLGKCRNGRIKTLKDMNGRHPDCCKNFENYYMEDGSVYCTENSNHTEISYICEKGNLTKTPTLAEECLHHGRNKNKGNRDGSTETRSVYYGPSYERSLPNIQEDKNKKNKDENTERRVLPYAPPYKKSLSKKQKYKKKDNKNRG